MERRQEFWETLKQKYEAKNRTLQQKEQELRLKLDAMDTLLGNSCRQNPDVITAPTPTYNPPALPTITSAKICTNKDSTATTPSYNPPALSIKISSNKDPSVCSRTGKEQEISQYGSANVTFTNADFRSCTCPPPQEKVGFFKGLFSMFGSSRSKSPPPPVDSLGPASASPLPPSVSTDRAPPTSPPAPQDIPTKESGDPLLTYNVYKNENCGCNPCQVDVTEEPSSIVQKTNKDITNNALGDRCGCSICSKSNADMCPCSSVDRTNKDFTNPGTGDICNCSICSRNSKNMCPCSYTQDDNGCVCNLEENFPSLKPIQGTIYNANIISSNKPTENPCLCSPSKMSLKSADLFYIKNIHDLATQHKDLLKQVTDLEQKSKIYEDVFNEYKNVNFLGRGPTDKYACVETLEPDQKTQAELRLENILLKNELKDMRIEVRQYLEKMEGPMQFKIESERYKCLQLEQKLEQASKEVVNLQKIYQNEINSLKMQLCTANTNVYNLNTANEQLMADNQILQKKCAKLEDDLIRQKLSEADTIKSLQQALDAQASANVVKEMAQIKDVKEECDLHVIARELSKILKECEPCGECITLPEDLTSAARLLKSLTDMIEYKLNKAEEDISPNMFDSPIENIADSNQNTSDSPTEDTALHKDLNENTFDSPMEATAVQEDLNQNTFDSPMEATAVQEDLNQNTFDSPKEATAVQEDLNQNTFDSPMEATAVQEEVAKSKTSGTFEIIVVQEQTASVDIGALKIGEGEGNKISASFISESPNIYVAEDETGKEEPTQQQEEKPPSVKSSSIKSPSAKSASVKSVSIKSDSQNATPVPESQEPAPQQEGKPPSVKSESSNVTSVPEGQEPAPQQEEKPPSVKSSSVKSASSNVTPVPEGQESAPQQEEKPPSVKSSSLKSASVKSSSVKSASSNVTPVPEGQESAPQQEEKPPSVRSSSVKSPSVKSEPQGITATAESQPENEVQQEEKLPSVKSEQQSVSQKLESASKKSHDSGQGDERSSKKLEETEQKPEVSTQGIAKSESPTAVPLLDIKSKPQLKCECASFRKLPKVDQLWPKTGQPIDEKKKKCECSVARKLKEIQVQQQKLESLIASKKGQQQAEGKPAEMALTEMKTGETKPGEVKCYDGGVDQLWPATSERFKLSHQVTASRSKDLLKSETSVKCVNVKENFPFDVDTQVDVLNKPPDGVHVTTTITKSGILEVITEGPEGVIETTLVYTNSGNIEVITEILQFEGKGIICKRGDAKPKESLCIDAPREVKVTSSEPGKTPDATSPAVEGVKPIISESEAIKAAKDDATQRRPSGMDPDCWCEECPVAEAAKAEIKKTAKDDATQRRPSWMSPNCRCRECPGAEATEAEIKEADYSAGPGPQKEETGQASEVQTAQNVEPQTGGAEDPDVVQPVSSENATSEEAQNAQEVVEVPIEKTVVKVDPQVVKTMSLTLHVESEQDTFRVTQTMSQENTEAT